MHHSLLCYDLLIPISLCVLHCGCVYDWCVRQLVVITRDKQHLNWVVLQESIDGHAFKSSVE